MAEQLCADDDVLNRLATPTRNRYFYGKLLDAFHFNLEQRYFNRKRWFLNRLAIGSGVLCGLQVAPTEDGMQIVVGPGAALDPLGREVIVPVASPAIDPRQPTDACGKPFGDRIEGEETVHICLTYHECEAEPVPVLVGDCDAPKTCVPNVVRERYCILVREGAPSAIAKTCGFPNLFVPPPPDMASQIHPQLVKRISQPCPEIEGDPCVVLAQIKLPAPDVPMTAAMIDADFRPVVYGNEILFELLLCLSEQLQAGTATPPAPSSTRIEGLSWNHDGQLELDEFLDTGLTVTFSDNITPLTARGDAWFIVTMEYPVAPMAELQPPFWPGTILVQRVLAETIDIQSNTATFKPAVAFKDVFSSVIEALGSDLALCRVVLKCSALQGADGQAIDGDFVLGTLPTGNGVPGGDFESWFTVTP